MLAADVVGYSGLMSKDEEGTLVRLGDLRRQVIEPGIQAHRGRLVKTVGDGFLVEFASPLAAVRCAVDLQEAVAAASDEPVKPFKLRIGIGDIMIEEDGDIFGDGVNIASRLEQMSPPGGICLSGKVYEEVRDKLPYTFEDQGEHQFKNIGRSGLLHPVKCGRHRGCRRRTEACRTGDGQTLHHDLSALPSISARIRAGILRRRYRRGHHFSPVQFRSFLVIARNATFTYKGRSVNVPQIGRQLGVRYVLEGSVRRSVRGSALPRS